VQRWYGWYLWLAWLLIACSGDDGAETLIGATCESAADCDIEGVCIVDGPGGMCSQRCADPGQAGACPLGSYCDRKPLTTDTDERAEMMLCLPACKSQDDCRDGYECTGVSGGPGKVCQPGS